MRWMVPLAMIAAFASNALLRDIAPYGLFFDVQLMLWVGFSGQSIAGPARSVGSVLYPSHFVAINAGALLGLLRFSAVVTTESGNPRVVANVFTATDHTAFARRYCRYQCRFCSVCVDEVCWRRARNSCPELAANVPGEQRGAVFMVRVELFLRCSTVDLRHLVAVIFFYGLYRLPPSHSRFDEVLEIVKVVTLGVLLAFIATFDQSDIRLTRFLIFFYWLGLLCFTAGGRVLVRSFERQLFLCGIGRRKTLIVGAMRAVPAC